MKTELTAPLIRAAKEFAPGAVLDLPESLAGKLINRGRAALVSRVVPPAAPDQGESA